MRIETEDIECAGEIVHALAESEGIRSLSSHIVFPAEFAKLNTILEQVKVLHCLAFHKKISHSKDYLRLAQSIYDKDGLNKRQKGREEVENFDKSFWKEKGRRNY